MNSFLTENEKQLCRTVKKAGEVLLSLWPGAPTAAENGSLRIEQKEDKSLVTEADFASNKLLVEELRTLYPNDRIISEEGPWEHNTEVTPRAWLVDPLDGTAIFVNGKKGFSILLALSVEARIEFSIAYFPVRKIFLCSKKGVGSFINEEPLSVSKETTLAENSVYYRYCDPEPRPCLFGGSLDTASAIMALGQGELMGIILRLRNHKEWDLAAQAGIIESAGGKVTDEHGEPLRFDQGGISFKYVIASNGLVHDEVLSFVP